jgi:hypothetical protein
MSVDPIKDGVNWYVYTGNNPVAYVDPMGLRASGGQGVSIDTMQMDRSREAAAARDWQRRRNKYLTNHTPESLPEPRTTSTPPPGEEEEKSLEYYVKKYKPISPYQIDSDIAFDFNIAIHYLSTHSKIAADLIQKIEGIRKAPLGIKKSDHTAIDIKGMHIDIYWDSELGVKLDKSGDIMSPALCLAHELAHFYLYETSEEYRGLVGDFGEYEWRKDNIRINQSAEKIAKRFARTNEEIIKYDNAYNELEKEFTTVVEQQMEVLIQLENMVINLYENKIAKELRKQGMNEGIRESYLTPKSNITVETPISTVENKDEL